MKKTCFGCRALDWNGQHKRCDLGYRQTWKHPIKFLQREPVPNEQCPKPRTYDKLTELYKAEGLFDYCSE